jgi:glycosyltransferase involved in cell wall biosynthesis
MARVLYDGWPLVHAPLGAAAWHLRELITLAPTNVEILLAMPVELPADALPKRVRAVLALEKDRGKWEQRTLQDLADKNEAICIHTTSLAASLLGKTHTLVSPGEIEGRGDRSRVAAAQGWGGLARARILWPQDAGESQQAAPVEKMPPVVHPAFEQHTAPASRLNLPDEYLLYNGSGDERVLLNLLESWTWAAASIGELYPLMLCGLSAKMKALIESKLPDFHLSEYVRVVDADAGDLPAIMQHCAAFVYPETPAAWGNPLRYALACGKAVVALKEPVTETIVGAAAYLIEPADLRGLGAATITVVVDEKAREALEVQAKQKSARWKADAFTTRLSEIYTGLAPAS